MNSLLKYLLKGVIEDFVRKLLDVDAAMAADRITRRWREAGQNAYPAAGGLAEIPPVHLDAMAVAAAREAGNYLRERVT